MASTVAPAARAGRMTLWRLEWLRLTRTPRALSLAAIFIFFGLLEPALTRYQSQIFSHLGNGVRISFPTATPAQAIGSYASELGGIGLIVVVVLAAGPFSFDAHRGLATFLRTRVAGFQRLVAPRFAVTATAAATAYLLGALAAWYETTLLIRAPAAAGMLGGILCGAVYLTFAVAVTALAASTVRSTLATVGIALAVLFLLPIAGTYHPVANWLPSALTGAPVALLNGTHHLAHYLPAFTTAVVASGAALTLAVLRLRAREI
jgi:ABC-2 type transport system permease protein